MTTRAGLIGLGTGLLLSGLLYYPLYHILPGFYIAGWPGGSRGFGMLLAVLGAALVAFGGCLAAHWGGAKQAWQRRWLGALAGGLAGILLFCSLGAAAAGALSLGFSLEQVGQTGIENRWIAETVLRSTAWTHETFWGLLLGGMLLGALGSLWPAPAGLARYLTPWPRDPQMALNASITAMPASAFAVIIAAALFSPLPETIQKGLAGPLSADPQIALDWPLTTALLLYLGSQLALALVTQHEARQVTHLCAIDEVKMAAYVGIFLPPVLLLALGLINWHLLLKPLVWCSLLLSLAMAAQQGMVLYKLILPRRAQMPPPADRWLALLFGVIADSHQGGLVLLCLGCGMLLAAPIYIAVVAAAINMAFVPVTAGLPIVTLAGWMAATQAGLVQRLYSMQANAGLGMSLVAALLLTVIYLFYSSLGKLARWLRRQ